MRIITSEQVSAGHPDKICDQIADAIVTDCLQHDRSSRVAIECLFKNRCLVIAGELTSTHEPDYKALVQQVFDRINNGGVENSDAGLDYKLDFTADDLDIAILVDHQSSDIALGVNVGGAGDQGMMYGYATNETPEILPIPFVLATRFLELLKAYPCRMLKADAKAQVSFDYDSGRITTFLCSVQHIRDVDVDDFREIIESAGSTMKIIAKIESQEGLDNLEAIIDAADGIMVARGAQGNPWIFAELVAKSEGREWNKPTREEVARMILRHAAMLIDCKGEYIGSREMRKHAAWYTKGYKGSSQFRGKLNEAESLEDLKRLMDDFLS